MADFSIAVDLGGTNLRIAAVSTDGRMLEKVTLGTNLASGPDRVVSEMCDAIVHLSGKYRGGGLFRGVGAGIPGILDLEAGKVSKSANLPGWSGYPVREEIERRLGAQFFLDNDGNMAALGEQWLGAARDVPNMAMVTLGTGIGGAIILKGKIFHGMNGMAGEFGHVPIEPKGVPCGCGSHGCSERYASATAVVRMAREAIAGGAAPGLAKAASADAEFGAKAVYNLALQGDEDARRIFRRFGKALGMLLAGMVNGLNLEMYVIGGGVSSAWDAFAPAMFDELRERSLIYAATEPEGRPGKDASSVAHVISGGKTIVTRALLGSDAGLYGAARMAVVGL
jgi:glucokinase